MATVRVVTAEPHILIIAYGNEFRGDDGAGPALGHLLEARPIPSARTVVCHQLVPELAEPLSRVPYAVFVDARTPDGDPRPHLRRLNASDGESPGIGHVSNPGDLLALSAFLYGSAPAAWLLSLPSESMGLGQWLTSTGREGVRKGSRAVRRLARRLARATE